MTFKLRKRRRLKGRQRQNELRMIAASKKDFPALKLRVLARGKIKLFKLSPAALARAVQKANVIAHMLGALDACDEL